MSDNHHEQDRRSAFRISEPAWVEFVLIEDIDEDQQEHPIEQLFENAQSFQLITEVKTLDMEFESLFSSRHDIDPVLTDLFKLLNRKINAATSLMTANRHNVSKQSVSLSEEGVGFYYKSPIPEDKVIAIRLRLATDNLGLVLKARVVYNMECIADDGEQEDELKYRIGCQLLDVDEQKRQLINRHILAFQAQQKRSSQGD